MRLKLTIAPTDEPVSLEETKNHLKIDSSEDNALISGLIMTARRIFEMRTGKALITQTWELHLNSAGEEVEIPKPPLQKVEKIETISTAGVKSEVTTSTYDIELAKDSPGRVKAKQSWPTHRGFDSFIVTFKAGYGDGDTSIPEDIKQAILQLIAYYYEGRQGSEEFPKAVDAIMALHKVYWL